MFYDQWSNDNNSQFAIYYFQSVIRRLQLLSSKNPQRFHSDQWQRLRKDKAADVRKSPNISVGMASFEIAHCDNKFRAMLLLESYISEWWQ